MKNQTRLIIPVFLLLGLICVLASVALAQDDTTAEPESTPEAITPSSLTDQHILNTEVTVAIEPTGDNGYCTICHNQPLRTVQLGDGSILNLYVNPAMIAASVHGPTDTNPGLGCLDCHGENAFPHTNTPEDHRQFTLEMNNLCATCHVEQGEELNRGLHAQAIANGDTEAAVCTDCHEAHHIQSAENFPELVAGVCGDCHTNTLNEWQASPHSDIGPLGCATCHDYHSQTLRAGDTVSGLCTTCHSQMPSIFAHDAHLTGENPIACESCHMFTGDHTQTTAISVLDLDNTGHTMNVSATPCTTCHSDLEESGEWAQIISTRFGVEVSTVPEANVEAATTEEENDDSGAATVRGLLVGLGLGVTFAVVFITRSMRRREA